MEDRMGTKIPHARPVDRSAPDYIPLTELEPIAMDLSILEELIVENFTRLLRANSWKSRTRKEILTVTAKEVCGAKMVASPLSQAMATALFEQYGYPCISGFIGLLMREWAVAFLAGKDIAGLGRPVYVMGLQMIAIGNEWGINPDDD